MVKTLFEETYAMQGDYLPSACPYSPRKEMQQKI